MSCCARCGQGICSTAGKIALNKVWHKGCFCCYNCNRPLNIGSAKIYYGEVFCSCCCPQLQELCPVKVCKVNSTPSCNPGYCQQIMTACCNSSESDCCHPRDVHSCSCIPACCTRARSPCGSCRDCCCEDGCFKRIHCRPRSPKPMNYPPRPPKCFCSRCCQRRRRPCSPPDPCCPPRRPCQPDPCCPMRRRSPCRRNDSRCCESKKMIYFRPRSNSPCNNSYRCKRRSRSPCSPCTRCYCGDERCRRCGEKVFAAEKVLTSHGAYHLGCFTCYCCCKSLCIKTMCEASGEIYCRQCYNNYFGIGGYGFVGGCC